MKPKYLNPNWRYINAEDTKKPGYLKTRFAQIRKQQAEQADKDMAERNEKVRTLKGAK